MELSRVTPKEFGQVFPTPFSVFNSVKFSELNRYKCSDIHYLVFSDRKKRLGIVLGETEDELKAPFSASYSGFCFNSPVALQHYDDACALLKEYSIKERKRISFTLAPPIYNSLDNAKTFGALCRAGAQISSIDYNHHFEVARFKNYESILDSKVRNKLRMALQGELTFVKLDSKNEDDVARVYDVIRINHSERGNPLRMSLQNVIDTIKIIPADFFVVSNNEGVDVAAAQIFHTTDNISQIVYWGDVPSFSYLKTMNYLSYKVFEYYYNNTKVKILDIGISTENGMPNYGLCEFKENIGCIATTRFSLVL